MSHTRSLKAGLLSTVCLSFLIIPYQARAEPDGCVESGNTATCLGDQSAGVIEGFSYEAPPVQIVIVESDTPIMPIAGNAGVDFSGEDAGLIDITLRAPGGVTITGNIAAGVNAILGEFNMGNPVLFDGNVTVNSIADITATGTVMQGISAQTGNGNVAVTSVGDITVSDSTGQGSGIVGTVDGTGNVTITSTGDIETTDVNPINAATQNGNVTVSHDGAITATSTGQEGITATVRDPDGSGNVSVTSAGSITVDDIAIGATTFDGSVMVENAADINTLSGPGVLAVVAVDGAAQIENTGQITTAETGLLAESAGSGQATITSEGDITISAPGIGLLARSGAGAATITSTGTVSTADGVGVGALSAAGGTVRVTQTGDVMVNGQNDPAIAGAATGGGRVNITSSGDLSTSGSGAANTLVGDTPAGIRADVQGGTFSSNGITIRHTGDISTTGDFADGVYATNLVGGPISITTTGDISVSGEASAGILAFGGERSGVNIFHTGDIIATGEDGIGIQASALDIGNISIRLEDGVVQGGPGAGSAIAIGDAGFPIRADVNIGPEVEVIGSIIANQTRDVVTVRGTLTGNVGLGEGSDRVSVMVGGQFNTGRVVDLGAEDTLSNSGRLAVAGEGEIGLTDVTGNLLLNPSSEFLVDLADMASDLMRVSGNVQLRGSLVLSQIGQALTPGTVYRIIEAGGDLTGNFSRVVQDLAPVFATTRISADGSTVLVELAPEVDSTVCDTTQTVTLCTGDISGGLTNQGDQPDFVTPGTFTLNINSVAEPIMPEAGQSGIEMISEVTGALEVNAEFDGQGISTEGDNAHGITVRNRDESANITITSQGDIATDGEGAHGIFAQVERRTQGDPRIGGNIAITSTGDITTRGDRSDGILGRVEDRTRSMSVVNRGDITTSGQASSGITLFAENNVANELDLTIDTVGAINLEGNGGVGIAAVNRFSSRGGAIRITSRGDITGDGFDTRGILALNSEGGDVVVVDHEGDITVAEEAILVETGERTIIEIDSVGDLTMTDTATNRSPFDDVISVTADESTANVVARINSTGNITGARNGDSGSGIGVEVNSNFQLRNSVEINSTGNIQTFDDRSNGIDVALFSRFPFEADITGDVMINSVGDITTEGETSDAIFVLVEGARAAVDIVSTGVLTVLGQERPPGLIVGGGSNGIAVDTGPEASVNVTANGQIMARSEQADDVASAVRIEIESGNSTVTLGAGDYSGGATGFAVDFRTGDAATNVLTTEAMSGLSALSGTAVMGRDGSETINNSGSIVGSVDLGGGMNVFNNLASGRFGSGPVVNLGAGVLNNSGTLAPGNSIGATEITGDLVLMEAGTLEIEIDISGGTPVSDTLTVSGMTTLAGTLSVSAIDALTMFAQGTVFDIIESSGGITGAFSQLVDTLPDLDIAFDVLAGEQVGQLSLVPTTITPPPPPPPPAMAGCAPDPVANGGSVTCTGTDSDGFQSASADVDLSVVDGARVSPDTAIAALSLSAGAPTITNAGVVESEGADAVELDNGGRVVNTATGIIRSNNQVVDAAGSIVIENAGLMEAETGSGTAIDVFRADAQITNSGTIRAQSGDGIDVDGDLTVTNSGTITSASETIRQFSDGNGATTTITNSGTISAVSGAQLGQAFGAITLGDDRVLAVENTGVIESGAGDAPTDSGSFPSNSAIKVRNSALTVNNTGDGRIEGADAAILASNGGSAQITNGGILTGRSGTAVQLDPLNAVNDSFTLLATGTVNGDVNLGDGDDMFTILGGGIMNGFVDLGPGSDTLIFDGPAGTVGTVAFLSGATPFATGVEQTIKRGEGTWIFAGDDVPASSDLAPIRVEAGTGVLQTNLPSAEVTVDAGARAEGAGTLGTLDNSGTLSTGGDGAIGAYRVVGDVTLNAPSVVRADIRSDGSSDRAAVGGDLSLAGELVVNALGMLSEFADMDQFLLFDVAGAVSGAFATVTDNLPDLDAVVRVSAATGGGQDVRIELVGGTVPDPDPDPDPDPGPDPDPDPDPGPGPNPPPPPPNTLSDKSIHPNTLQAAAHVGREFGALLMSQAGTGRGAVPLTLPSKGVTVSSLGTYQKPPAYYAWLSAYGSYLDVDATAATTGYQSDTYGLAFGIEQVFDRETMTATLGFAGGYATSDVGSALSSSDIETYSFGVYGSLEQGPWLMSAALSYGHQEYDVTRIIPVGAGAVAARGSTDGDVFTASAKIAYDLAPSLGLADRHQMRLAPYLRFDHVHADRDGYTETGAGVLNLAVAADSFTQNIVSLGVEASSVIAQPNGTVIRPFFDLRWEHVLDGASATTNSFVAGTPGATFTTVGASLDRDRLGIGAGIRIDTSRNTSFDIRYDGLFSSHSTEHQARVQFTMNF